MLASTKETPKRLLVVPLDWEVQVAPPSSVRRMVPLSPTEAPALVHAPRCEAERRLFAGHQVLKLTAEILDRHARRLRHIPQHLRVFEVVAPQADHVAPRDGVTVRAHIH